MVNLKHMPEAVAHKMEEMEIYTALGDIFDPEIPVLSVTDLGIVRQVVISEPGKSVEISITPTYSGCPAMEVISTNIRVALLKRGYQNVNVLHVLSPPWTTDWMTESGKQKLKAYGIAPPAATAGRVRAMFSGNVPVQCPQCDSFNTQMISEFGSTSCKALYRCNECLEAFDMFKCH